MGPGAGHAVAVAVNGPARLLAIMGSGETTPDDGEGRTGSFSTASARRPCLPSWSTRPTVSRPTPRTSPPGPWPISGRRSAGRWKSPRCCGPRGPVPWLWKRHWRCVGEARWVFAGPGSPTYALRQWRPTVLPQLLADKLAHGGCLVFSSAAALTLGRWTVPVYEIYKVGADPVWEEGLDLLGPLGLDVAVIPHYDNAEGGTHDTRYCYLGEPRLQASEASCRRAAWVLGVDEHTVCVLDLEAGTVTVAGLGGVTVRRQGTLCGRAYGQEPGDKRAGRAWPTGRRSRPLCSGVYGPGLRPPPATNRHSAGAAGGETGRRDGTPTGPIPQRSGGRLTDDVKRLTAVFDAALAQRDAEAATAAALELESSLHAWSADTFQSDEVDRARAALRRMVLRLGELAAPGVRDPGTWPLLGSRLCWRNGSRPAEPVALRTPTVSATPWWPWTWRCATPRPARTGIFLPGRRAARPCLPAAVVSGRDERLESVPPAPIV